MGWVILLILFLVISAIVGAVKYRGVEGGALVTYIFVWLAGIVVSLGIPTTLIYLAWHFAHKHW